MLPDLPNEWSRLRVGENNVDIFDGPFGSNLKTSDYVDSGVRVIRLENIGSLKFIENKKTYISNEKYELLKRHQVCSGDIVFSSFVIDKARVALVPESVAKAINKADCFCVRVKGEKLDKKYLVMFLSTRQVYKQIEELVHGVGRPRINTTQLRNIWVPICSIEEQKEIVKCIEALLSEIDTVNSDIEKNLLRSEALRQSILKKAFSGKLVPQDPNDEPASELLKRIAQEKADREVELKAEKESAKKAKKKTTTTKNKASKKVKTV